MAYSSVLICLFPLRSQSQAVALIVDLHLSDVTQTQASELPAVLSPSWLLICSDSQRDQKLPHCAVFRSTDTAYPIEQRGHPCSMTRLALSSPHSASGLAFADSIPPPREQHVSYGQLRVAVCKH